ncbi:MAG: tRNA 2-thiouridine(34) synthase MnmA [Atopobiaceae bacterium]|nr:tRNA 2-thiouridine(34) synthase MnmA [Atopobiaceae bacterium]
MARILVALSGGVDSSVCALLFKQAGHECIGVTRRLVTNDSIGIIGETTCCSLSDILDARAVCGKLGIPHHVFDLDDVFTEHVILPFSDAYAAGLTPNPCILCNRHMKFDLLWTFAKQLGCDGMATGHYARVVHTLDGTAELHRARDAAKDQSYVLYPCPQEVLRHLHLPLGDLSGKDETRRIAEENGLLTAHKQDSQDICFVPDGDYPAFLERFRKQPLVPGEIVDAQGTVLGTHPGIEHFTIGQRKGLDVSVGKRMYVVDKDPDTARITIDANEALFSDRFDAVDANWLDGAMPKPVDGEPARIEGEVVVCHHGIPHRAVVIPTGPDGFSVHALESIRAVAPGQSAVLYVGDKVFCGGAIAR